LLKPGDAALVDDPGYYNLFGSLRLQGVEMLAEAHRPKVYFTQSVMQNPTGTDMSPHVSFKVLQAAGATTLSSWRMTSSAICR
jgi:DNA-binding transcriptional MocR family regulator